jgi:hypothetical protein
LPHYGKIRREPDCNLFYTYNDIEIYVKEIMMLICEEVLKCPDRVAT